jgi:hypothetical protein
MKKRLLRVLTSAVVIAAAVDMLNDERLRTERYRLCVFVDDTDVKLAMPMPMPTFLQSCQMVVISPDRPLCDIPVLGTMSQVTGALVSEARMGSVWDCLQLAHVIPRVMSWLVDSREVRAFSETATSSSSEYRVKTGAVGGMYLLRSSVSNNALPPVERASSLPVE